MLFAVTILDKPGMASTRQYVRAAHIAYLQEHAARLILAGPVMNEEGGSVGSVRIVEAPDRETVERLTEADPFAKAGCFATVTIHPYRIVFKDGRLVE